MDGLGSYSDTHWLVVDYPSEKYELVSWDDYSQYIYIWKNKCSKPPTRSFIAVQQLSHLELQIIEDCHNLSQILDGASRASDSLQLRYGGQVEFYFFLFF
jgi:hypothetical protein